MADIQVYQRVIDYVGLNVKPIPERSLALFRELQPVLALLQGMGTDGAKLVSVDALGQLKVALATQGGGGTVVIGESSGVRSAALNNLPDASAATNSLWVGASQMVWNGAFWDRAREASAANLALQSGLGVAMSRPSGEWSIFSQPGAGVQASASRAAVAAQRHVCTAIDFSAVAAVAPAAQALIVNLRDGATGAGTVLRSWLVWILAAIGQSVPPFGLSGLNIVGSVNTNMTLEFSALLANLQESVSLSGYTAA